MNYCVATKLNLNSFAFPPDNHSHIFAAAAADARTVCGERGCCDRLCHTAGIVQTARCLSSSPGASRSYSRSMSVRPPSQAQICEPGRAAQERRIN